MTLREDVNALALPAGRVTGSQGHEAARRFLVDRLKGIGLLPYGDGAIALPYRASGQEFCNLVTVAPGRDRGLAPVLIGAHYDSAIPAPSADDNAAAVAIALAAGEHFIKEPAERDLVLALFDAEEPPHFHGPTMGSIRFYEDQRRPQGFHAVVVMDLVGHDVPSLVPGAGAMLPNFSHLLFVTGAESHPRLPDLVRRSRPDSLPVVATLNRRVGDMSDHHVFRLNGVPYLFLSCGRWEHYHRPSDTPEKLNYGKMEAIAGFLIRTVSELCATELLPVKHDSHGQAIDTTSFELELLSDALGPPGLKLLGQLVGLPRVQSERDLDHLAERLQAYLIG